MARIRSVKPDLFINEQVGDISMAARFLFIGLFTQVDKAGRLEWAPKRLKVQLFPYDTDLDLGALADELVTAKLARIYQVDGVYYLDLPAFMRHQRPHPKEPESTLPACPDDWQDHQKPWKETASRVLPGSIPSSPVGREGKEISDQEGSGTAPAISIEVGPPSVPRGPKRYGASLVPGVSAGVAALVELGPGRVLEIPESWARRARNDYGLSHTDIDMFARVLGEQIRAAGGTVDDAGKRFPWLDAKLAAWRTDKHDAEVAARNEALWRREDEERRSWAAQPTRTPEQIRALLTSGRAASG